MNLILSSLGATNFEDEVLVPDYSALILVDKITIDAFHFDTPEGWDPNPHQRRLFETVNALRSEGFVEIRDFSSVLRSQTDLLARMLANDLKAIDAWVEPFAEAIKPVSNYWNQMNVTLHSDWTQPMPHRGNRGLVYGGPLERYHDKWRRGTATPAEAKISAIGPFLEHVNDNIVLANQFGAGFHDWAHIGPFYRRKFLSVGIEDLETSTEAEASRELFRVSFPDLAINDTGSLLRALNDNRIVDLRNLVSDAARGRAEFDQQFANRVLSEVFGIERRSARVRRFVSYATAPLSLIPGVGSPLQKLVEEIASSKVDDHLKRDYRWFYMLCDIAEDSPNP